MNKFSPPGLLGIVGFNELKDTKVFCDILKITQLIIIIAE
jgi:hypothetical protein